MSKNIICMLHIISLCAQILQNVKYWFEKCGVLVPIFYSVKFAKCEICGSKGLQCHLSPLKDIVCKLTYRRCFMEKYSNFFNYHKIGSFIKQDRRQSKTL